MSVRLGHERRRWVLSNDGGRRDLLVARTKRESKEKHEVGGRGKEGGSRLPAMEKKKLERSKKHALSALELWWVTPLEKEEEISRMSPQQKRSTIDRISGGFSWSGGKKQQSVKNETWDWLAQERCR